MVLTSRGNSSGIFNRASGRRTVESFAFFFFFFSLDGNYSYSAFNVSLFFFRSIRFDTSIELFRSSRSVHPSARSLLDAESAAFFPLSFPHTHAHLGKEFNRSACLGLSQLEFTRMGKRGIATNWSEFFRSYYYP